MGCALGPKKPPKNQRFIKKHQRRARAARPPRGAGCAPHAALGSSRAASVAGGRAAAAGVTFRFPSSEGKKSPPSGGSGALRPPQRHPGSAPRGRGGPGRGEPPRGTGHGPEGFPQPRGQPARRADASKGLHDAVGFLGREVMRNGEKGKIKK